MVQVPRERPTTFGQFLRKTREETGLSLRSTAKKAGVSACFLSDVERGYRLPSAGVLKNLSTVLEVPESAFREFDPRPHLRTLNQSLEAVPELVALLAPIVELYRAGKLSYAELAQLLRR